jgi:hypothetical protein
MIYWCILGCLYSRRNISVILLPAFSKLNLKICNLIYEVLYTGYFTSDNEPSGIENAIIHNTFPCLT